MKYFPDTLTIEHFRFVNYTQLTGQDRHSVWEVRNHHEIGRWMVNQAFTCSRKSRVEVWGA